jgi:hypothetical protein
LTNTTQFEGAGSPDAFFAAIVANPNGGTLVKVSGSFNPGNNTITVEEAELED